MKHGKTMLAAMSAEIVTTLFLAHPKDLEEAYETYLNRVEASPALIHAISPHPQPVDDPYTLWNLRTEAAYDNLAAPEAMQLFEANALVDMDGADRDTILDNFFLDESFTTARFPSQINGLTGLVLRDPIPHDSELSLVTVVYLGADGAEERMQQLFNQLLAASHVVAYEPEIALADALDNPDLIGPLWIRDATLNIIGRGDRVFSPGKDAWSGWFLTPDCLPQVENRLTEQFGPETVIIARAIAEPF